MCNNVFMTKILFVWDFHGVLEKGNEYAVQELCNLVFKEFGYDRRLNIKETRDWYGLSWFDYFKLSIPDANEEVWNKMVDKVLSFQERGWGIVQKHLQPRDFAKEVLSEIQISGHENILLSNTRPEHIRSFTDAIGITEYFEKIIGVDENNNSQVEDGSVNVKSQALKNYLDGKNFRRIIVIGDRDIDIKAGQDNGAVTYLFQNPDFAVKQFNINPTSRISDLREVLQELVQEVG